MHVLQAGGLSSRVEGAVQEAKKRDMDDLHQDGETRAPGMWIACIAALTSRNKWTPTPTDTHTHTHFSLVCHWTIFLHIRLSEVVL